MAIYFKKTFIAIILILPLAVSNFVFAATQSASTGDAGATTNFSFTPIKIHVQQGQIFSLKIDINPRGIKNYTVKASIKFPPELVALKTWTYTNNWMPLRQSGYDYFNNTSGVLIRTAGYPEGFDKITKFGSAVFIAKKSGTGVIEFTSDSMSLDENGNNIYIGGNKSTIIVASLSHDTPEGVSTEIPSTTQEIINPSAGEIVEQLFDINFIIESPVIRNSGDLVAKTQFTSFGTVPTPVSMAYRIEDIGGKVVYTEKDEVTVETEKLVIKEFKSLNLIEGKYRLILTTIYGDNIKDEFRQEFEVKNAPAQSKKIFTRAWAILFVIVGICALIIYLFKKRKKEN